MTSLKRIRFLPMIVKIFFGQLWYKIEEAFIGFFFYEDTMYDEERDVWEKCNALDCIISGYYPQGFYDKEEDYYPCWGIPMAGVFEDISIIDNVKSFIEVEEAMQWLDKQTKQNKT